MSKSRGNIVNPDIHIADHGADVTRRHLLSVGRSVGCSQNSLTTPNRRAWDEYPQVKEGSTHTRIPSLVPSPDSRASRRPCSGVGP